MGLLSVEIRSSLFVKLGHLLLSTAKGHLRKVKVADVCNLFAHIVFILAAVPAGSPSGVGDVTVYVWH